MLEDKTGVEQAMHALAAQLEAAGAGRFELVVIGGAALNVLGTVSRATRDVDVLALGTGHANGVSLIKSKPLPDALLAAADRVARDLDLGEGWLNAGPADLLDHGMPPGFADRLHSTRYGPGLTVYYPAREDLIALKVYAAADTGVGRHTQDLEALSPTPAELFAGAVWARTQDPSEGFRSMLVALLNYVGATEEAERLDDDA